MDSAYANWTVMRCGVAFEQALHLGLTRDFVTRDSSVVRKGRAYGKPGNPEPEPEPEPEPHDDSIELPSNFNLQVSLV